MAELPVNLLKRTLGKRVKVTLKDGSVYSGILRGYDEHVNITLDDVEKGPSKKGLLVIRGPNILFIEPLDK